MRTTFVYFIQAGDDRGAVKIGYSGDVERRLEELKTGNHLPLRIIGKFAHENAAAIEGALHKAFATLRLEGEWFAFDARIENVMAALDNRFPAAAREQLAACSARLIDGKEMFAVEWSDRQGCIHIQTLAASLAVALSTLLLGLGEPQDYTILAVCPTREEAHAFARSVEPWLHARRLIRRAGANR